MRVIEALKGILLTKAHVGLGNVDNTADADKPVSTAQAAADAAVAATAAGADATHAALTVAHGATGAVVGTTNVQTLTNKTLTAPALTSPTGIVKGDVGLGNVDNTSDVNKPVSTAQQTALDLKLAIPAGSNDDLLQRKSGLWVPRTLAQVKADMGLDRVTNIKDASGSLSPSTSDDGAAGYSVGSVWGSDMAHQAWVCTDNTNGAAVWKRIDLNIGGLTPTTDNMVQAVGSAWASRTPAQVRTALALVPGTDVQAFDADLATIAGLTATTDSFIQAKSSNWAARTIAQVRADLGVTTNVLLDYVATTDLVNGGALTANTAATLLAATAFTVTRTGAPILIAVGGAVLASGAANNASNACRLKINGVATRPISMEVQTVSQFINALSGNAIYLIAAGLTAGVNTVAVEIMSNFSGLFYCIPGSAPDYYSLHVQVLEFQ